MLGAATLLILYSTICQGCQFCEHPPRFIFLILICPSVDADGIQSGGPRKHRLLSSNRQIKVHHKNFHYGREIMLRLASCNKIVLILFPTLLLTAPVFSQDKPDTDETANLQKATQNPVASLISVPVQNNSNFDIFPQ